MSNGIFLLLGSNLGDRPGNLARARDLIRDSVGPITVASGVYETAAWGKTDQPSFFNQVIMVNTTLSPVQLLTHVLSIEHEMGRVRHEKWGPRLIDIDVLFYNNLMVSEPDLAIPHPGIPRRRFVLEPLNEIAPDFFHPGLHKTVHQLLQACSDSSNVMRL